MKYDTGLRISHVGLIEPFDVQKRFLLWDLANHRSRKVVAVAWLLAGNTLSK
jgi:hypothetical protein